MGLMDRYFFLKCGKQGWFLNIFGLLLLAPAIIPMLSGHDSQRIAFFLISALSLIALITNIRSPSISFDFGALARYACVAVVFLGVVSALCAHQVGWALVEVSLVLACCCVGTAIANERQKLDTRFDKFLVSLVIFLCIFKTLQFIAGVAAAFTSGVGVLDTTLLFEGFSNRRTYGHLQTFTLPLLAYPLLCKSQSGPGRNWLFVLLILWWMIAIASGTRGTWLGMAVGGVAMLFSGAMGRKWLGWQITGALAGCFLYWVIFSELPSLFDVRTLNPAGERLTSNLSAREIIWQQALVMIKARPLLGFGPMHFADIVNEIAAHPHQSVLQWASEWGIPSALMVGWLACRGLIATARTNYDKPSSDEPVDYLRICLLASLIGALAQSMVDGVMVMPYSQLWLCIIVGWLLGMHKWRRSAMPVSSLYSKSVLTAWGAALIFLGYVVVSDVLLLKANRQLYQSEFGGHFQPRFWMQGVIAKAAPRQLPQGPSPDTFSAMPK
jgi:O-antigen ligase